MYEIILDTEATPCRRTNNVDPRCMRVYDIGWVVVDGEGNPVHKANYVVQEVFSGSGSGLMQNAYYRDKLVWYECALRTGALTSKPLADIWREFAECCKQWRIRHVWAYNVKFDIVALNGTVNHYSNGFVPEFLPSSAIALDLWEYFGRSFAATARYVKWCTAHQMITAKGNPITTAEAAYRYLTNNPEFVESHTALDDAEREAYILRRCRKRCSNVYSSKKWGNGWRKAAAIARHIANNENPNNA